LDSPPCLIPVRGIVEHAIDSCIISIAETADLDWESFVCERALAWQKMLTSWLTPHQSVMVVQYEELETHTRKELLKILKFIGAPYSVTKLIGVQWPEEGAGIDEGMEDFQVQLLECVNLAITKSEKALFMTKNTDLTSYHRKPDD
jgi:hypothetical protein